MHTDCEHNAWHIDDIKNILAFLALTDFPHPQKGKVQEPFSRSDLVQVPPACPLLSSTQSRVFLQALVPASGPR